MSLKSCIEELESINKELVLIGSKRKKLFVMNFTNKDSYHNIFGMRMSYMVK